MRRTVLQIVLAAIVTLTWVGTAAAQTEIEVIINDMEVTALNGSTAYEVAAYVTVADAEEQPITTLSIGDFSVSQDGDDVELSSAAITSRSATIVLAIDTSGSMANEGTIAAVRWAASSFVNGLGPEDQVGIIYFNDEIVVAQGLSDDLQAAETIVNLIEAESNSGTCLYDAAYDAVAMATAAPPGQRAVVLLTDGVDELPNNAGPCSTHSLDDVTGLASEGGIHVPVYTIGLGSRIDDAELSRIAERTGGDALIAPNASDVNLLFQTIAAQLRSQYALIYTTTTTSGEHTLTVIASSGGATGVGTDRFVTPAQLSLTGLDEGALLDGAHAVRATVSGEGVVVYASFAIDGRLVYEAAGAPFEVYLDSAMLQPGVHTLTVTVMLDDGAELTTNLDFEVPSPATEALQESLATGDGLMAEAIEGRIMPFWQPWMLPVAIGGGVLLAVGVIGLIFFGASRRRAQSELVPSSIAPDEEVTLFDVALSEQLPTGIRPVGLPASLSVTNSPVLRSGQRFDLVRSLIRMGRSRMNDVIISDPSVSRRHAEIRLMSGEFWVFDAGSSYGTFVNNDRVGMEGRELHNGDELRLGPQTTFAVILPSSEGEPTQIKRRTAVKNDEEITMRWSDEGGEG